MIDNSIAGLTEDMAAEQKARATYDNILPIAGAPDDIDVNRILRKREVVHFQRSGEAMNVTVPQMDRRNVYAVNPAFDKGPDNTQGFLYTAQIKTIVSEMTCKNQTGDRRKAIPCSVSCLYVAQRW